jgi:hypothetical protein
VFSSVRSLKIPQDFIEVDLKIYGKAMTQPIDIYCGIFLNPSLSSGCFGELTLILKPKIKKIKISSII